MIDLHGHACSLNYLVYATEDDNGVTDNFLCMCNALCIEHMSVSSDLDSIVLSIQFRFTLQLCKCDRSAIAACED